MNKEERNTQKKGPPTHQAKMAIRKYHRDRRGEPEMTDKRAMLFIAAWGASEYARYYGVGLKKNLIEE